MKEILQRKLSLTIKPSFLIGVVSFILFISISYFVPHPNGNYSELVSNFILVIVSVGIISLLFFVIGLLEFLYKATQPKNRKPKGFGYFMLGIILLGILNVVFFLLMFNFLIPADGLPDDQQAIIGGQNLWRIVFFYGFFTSIFVFISFWRKFFRGVAIILFLFWLAGTFIVFMISQYGFGTAFTQDQTVINRDKVVTDISMCSEAAALANAKLCTTLVIRDDGGHGSAFSIYDGYLITNKHVIEGAKELVTYIGENEYPTQLWNYSPSYDLAILKIPDGLGTCSWFDSKNMQVAETVYTVGWPLDTYGESTVAKGIFSRMLNNEEGNYIQTDASINAGNSGGPLINKCGVVGINTAKIEEVGVEGLGFVLPSSELIPVVEQLINEGREDIVIPVSNNEYKRNYVPPENNRYIINIEEVKSYLSSIHRAKNSWNNCKGCDQDDLRRLMDSFDRQISFCNTLIERLSSGKRPSQDDIFMWDTIIKLSYESSAIASRLNSR